MTEPSGDHVYRHAGEEKRGGVDMPKVVRAP
jgi:hypothetical protein